MAMYFSNYGLQYLLNNAISASTDFRAAVFTGTPPSAATFADYQWLSNVTGSYTEANAGGTYSRQDLAGVAVNEVDGTKATITANAPTINSVTAGETWTFIVYYVEGASDAARAVICMDDPASDMVTNGGNITLPAMSIDFSPGAGNFTMTSFGLLTLLNTAITGSTDIRCAPFTGTKPSAATLKTWNYLQTAIDDASSAMSTHGGARYDLANVAVNLNATPDNVTITADAPTWTSVAAGETWTFVVYYIYNASDAAAPLLAIDLTTSGQVTNGGNISYSALSITIND